MYQCEQLWDTIGVYTAEQCWQSLLKCCLLRLKERSNSWEYRPSNNISTVSATSVLSLDCIRCYPLLSAGNMGQFVHLLLRCIRTVLPPYSLLEISSVLYPLRSAASVRMCERGIRNIHRCRKTFVNIKPLQWPSFSQVRWC